VTSLDVLSKYPLITELCFDAMMCSKLCNESSGADYIKVDAGRKLPTPFGNDDSSKIVL